MKIDNFDIDELMQLAEKDPEGLEQLRLREVEKLISKAPSSMQRRLRGLQFQIDCHRKLHSNPMGSCVAISQMMLDSLRKLNFALHGSLEPGQEIGEQAQGKASVLNFTRAVND